MRLKPIEWVKDFYYDKAYTSKGITLEVVNAGSSKKKPKWYWYLSAGDSGDDYGNYSTTYALSGAEATEAEATAAVERALLEYLLSFLEPDNEPSCPRNHGDGGQDTIGDGCGDWSFATNKFKEIERNAAVNNTRPCDIDGYSH